MLMLFDVLMSPSFDEIISEYMPDVKSFTENESVLSDIGSTYPLKSARALLP
jgi:hypothetical protein